MFSLYLKPLTEGADRVNHRRTNGHHWDSGLRFISHVSLTGRKLPLNVVKTLVCSAPPQTDFRQALYACAFERNSIVWPHTHNSRLYINQVFDDVILK